MVEAALQHANCLDSLAHNSNNVLSQYYCHWLWAESVIGISCLWGKYSHDTQVSGRVCSAQPSDVNISPVAREYTWTLVIIEPC